MKKSLIYIILLFLLTETSLSAQILTGSVLDSKTREPIINANVYLEGTSYFTITDVDGHFSLPVKKAINAKLIISHISYEQDMIADPFNSLQEVILLREKDNAIGEVVVKGKKGRFSRKQMMNVFRKQFLGTSRAGKNCIIMNEEDIMFLYDASERTLFAYCDVPVIIKNPYLGYEIFYELKLFRAKYYSNTIQNADLKTMLFVGPSSYKDISEGDVMIAKRRRDAFAGSTTHFFRSLIRDQIKESKLSFYSNLGLLSPDKVFTITDNPKRPSTKIIITNSDKQLEYDSTIEHDSKQVYESIGVIYEGWESRIIFATKQLMADFYGNIYEPENIYVSGRMSEKRLGDMLPIDYESE